MSKNYAIYFYNSFSKEKYIIFETDKTLEKIYLKWNEIIFEDNKWEIYKLENYMK